MKQRLHHIALSLLLATTIIVMAGGVTLHRCACSGKVTMTLGAADNGQGDAPGGKGCMTTTAYTLSPTTQVQASEYHFHAVAPVAAFVSPCRGWAMPVVEPRHCRPLCSAEAYSPPPRQRLRLLRVLII